MKFGAHQTFYLRSSWLHKGLSAVTKDSKLLHRKTAAEKLGIGKNMLDALRYWLEAVQLVTRRESGFFLSKNGEKIFNHDRFFELDGTSQLLHYLLASNEVQATTWHWFFNKFSANKFEVDSLSVYLQSYVSTSYERKVSENTLTKDINCLLRMYRSEKCDSKHDPESNNPSPFSRFHWIEKDDAKYTRRNISSEEVEPLIFIYTLYLFWKEKLQEAKSISLDEIANKENSPGVIFGLSMEQCAQVIEKIERNYQNHYLDYNKSGGYYIVSINKKHAKNALSRYYEKNEIMEDQ